MLYHLLTGRTPFAAETPLGTLRKVMEEEPAAPSKLSPKTSPDLETICLKCLEKRPERRYHSARELAEELERFLNHEPILATPASAWRKTWSSLLKHPWLLMGAATFVGLSLLGLAYGLWERVQYVEWKAAHPGRQFSKRTLASILPELHILFIMAEEQQRPRPKAAQPEGRQSFFARTSWLVAINMPALRAWNMPSERLNPKNSSSAERNEKKRENV